MSASLDGRMLRVSVGAVAAVFALNYQRLKMPGKAVN